MSALVDMLFVTPLVGEVQTLAHVDMYFCRTGSFPVACQWEC
ncbi:hypothetical protein SLEP1_g55017 [Rubroshorea leprosula]|uniref:Uncharacterized protein n=1 Tax=Rubroshorea leprosula TaxID=152421 RepID=A0AAV5MHB4_9ROSI|nr:hypothetical protein SLEP1_g55017 [Rubroshorea leprosula]